MEAESGRSLTVVVRRRGKNDQGPKQSEPRSRIMAAELIQKGTNGGICKERGGDRRLRPEEHNKLREGGVLQLEGDTLWGVYGEAITDLMQENEQLRVLVNQLAIRNQILSKRLTGLGWSAE